MDTLKSMSNNMKQSESKDGQIQALLGWNDLIYKEAKTASLITARHFERFNAQNLNYTSSSSSMDFLFSTGDQMLDGDNSWIQFNLNVAATGVNTYDFGNGSVMNLFRTAILHSRQGDEVDRIDDVGIYRANADYERAENYFITSGTAMGYGVTYDVGTSYRFQVPLCACLNIFGTGRLIPAQLISGARLQLDLAPISSKRVFAFDAAATDISYTISNAEIVVRTSRPTDETSRELEKQAAANGLEFSWPAVYSQKHNVTTQISEQVSKSVARALRLYVVPLERPANDYTDCVVVPTGVEFSNAQARAGSLYMPQYRLSQDDVFQHNLCALDKVKEPIRYSKSGAEAEGLCWITDLESHNLIHYAGQSLNNSRSLVVESTFNAPSNTDRDCHLFLTYQRVSRAFMNSIAVDS